MQRPSFKYGDSLRAPTTLRGARLLFFCFLLEISALGYISYIHLWSHAKRFITVPNDYAQELLKPVLSCKPPKEGIILIQFKMIEFSFEKSSPLDRGSPIKPHIVHFFSDTQINLWIIERLDFINRLLDTQST